MHGHRMLATWTLLLCTGAVWEGLCSHSVYDLRLSTEDCTRWKDIGTSGCSEHDASCASPSTVKLSSPRWLSTLAGAGGPLMTWIPLLVGSKDVAPVHDVLRAALPWYLGFIGPVRHTHRLFGSHWDPSGHVFVYGSQLVPLASIKPQFLHPITKAWLALWAVALTYLSFTTASFFHATTETLAGYALVAILWAWCSRFSIEAHTPGSASGCHSTLRRGIFAPVLWGISTAISWVLCGPAEMSKLVSFLGYDAILWVMLLWLSSRTHATLESDMGVNHTY